MSISGMTGCSSYDLSNGGKLFDVQRYIDFFTKPAAQGGVKINPDDVILVAITAPADPVGRVRSRCPAPTRSTRRRARSSTTRASRAANTKFFGDPAVRV